MPRRMRIKETALLRYLFSDGLLWGGGEGVFGVCSMMYDAACAATLALLGAKLFFGIY